MVDIQVRSKRLLKVFHFRPQHQPATFQYAINAESYLCLMTADFGGKIVYLLHIYPRLKLCLKACDVSHCCDNTNHAVLRNSFLMVGSELHAKAKAFKAIFNSLTVL